MRPIIRDSEVRRVRPREYKEFAHMDIAAQQPLVSSDTGMRGTLNYPLVNHHAKRLCRKDGRPLSPWLIIVGCRAYTIDEGDEA